MREKTPPFGGEHLCFLRSLVCIQTAKTHTDPNQ